MVEAAKRPLFDIGGAEVGVAPYSHECERVFLFQTAIADFSQVALRGTPIDLLFSTISTRVAQLLQVDLVSVMEVEDDSRLRLTSGYGWPAGCIGAVVSEWQPDGVSAYPALLNGPIVDGFLGVPPRTAGLVPDGTANIATLHTVPIGGTESPVGAFGVFSYSNRPITPDEVTFLRAVAEVLTSAVDRSHAEEKARGEAEERTILAEIGRIMGSSLEIDEVYSRFVEQVQRLIAFDRIAVNIIDAANGTFSSEYVAGVPIAGWKKGVPQPLAGRGVEAVTRSGTGVIVQGDKIADFLEDYPLTEIGEDCGLNSLMNVPVFWHGELTGVLSLRSHDANAYSMSDLRVAERICTQVAGSLANSSLHARQREYARQQATLAEISRVVASSVRIDEIYPKFARAVGKLIPFDRISITTIDEETGTAMARYVWGAPFAGSRVMVSRPIAGTATGAVAEARAGMIITSEMVEEQSDRFNYIKVGLDAGLKSTLVVPLMHRGKAIGSLVLKSWDENVYSSGDMVLAERVAVQISGVVWAAHLNEELEKTVREQAVLAELGKGIIEARELEAVFSRIHGALAQLIEFDRIVVGIFDPDRSSLRIEYVRGVNVPGLNRGTELSRPTYRTPGVTWADVMSPYYGTNDRAGLDGRGKFEAIEAAGLRGWLQAPLKSRDRYIGFISLRSKREDAYASTDLHLLERAAAQVAPGLDNVQYYLRVEQDYRLTASLEQMAGMFGQAEDHYELLANFVSEIRDCVPADCVNLTTAVPSYLQLAVDFNAFAIGYDEMQPELVELNSRITERVLRDRRSLSIESSTPRHDENDRLVDHLKRAGFSSSLSVPLMSFGQVVAILHFHSAQGYRYSHRYQLMAERAGMLLMNALGPVVGARATGSHAHQGEASSPPLPTAILVDSKTPCRQALRAWVQEARLPVAVESDSIHEVTQLMQSTGARILLWELHEGDEADLSALTSLRSAHPGAKVVMIDNGCDSELLGDAMRHGVTGFLVRDTTAVRLAESLQRVADGEVVVNPQALRSYFTMASGQPGILYHPAVLGNLRERDVAILKAVARGCTNSEIAAELNFAVGTIKNRLARIYRVLGVSDRAGAMALAIRAGLGE